MMIAKGLLYLNMSCLLLNVILMDLVGVIISSGGVLISMWIVENEAKKNENL